MVLTGEKKRKMKTYRLAKQRSSMKMTKRTRIMKIKVLEKQRL